MTATGAESRARSARTSLLDQWFLEEHNRPVLSGRRRSVQVRYGGSSSRNKAPIGLLIFVFSVRRSNEIGKGNRWITQKRRM